MSPRLSQTVLRVIAFLCFVRVAHPLTRLPVCPPTQPPLHKHASIFASFQLPGQNWFLFIYGSVQTGMRANKEIRNKWSENIKDTLPPYSVRACLSKICKSKWRGEKKALGHFVWLFMLVFRTCLHTWITALLSCQNPRVLHVWPVTLRAK